MIKWLLTAITLLSIFLLGCVEQQTETLEVKQPSTVEVHKQVKPVPSFTIKSPAEGQVIEGDEVTLELFTSDLALKPAGDTINSNEGHFHVWLDAQPDDPQASYIKLPKSTHIFTDIKPGKHKMDIWLVQNNHFPFSPPQKKSVSFTTKEKPLEITTTPLPAEQIYTIEADDHGLYPSTLIVKKGNKVKISFKVRNSNVYYGGLDFRSDYFSTGKLAKGESKTVEFTAEKTFTYASYWPASNVKKADGKILVE